MESTQSVIKALTSMNSFINKFSLYTFGIPIKGKNIVYVVEMFLNSNSSVSKHIKFIFSLWYLDRNTDMKRIKMMAFNLFLKHTNMRRYVLKNTSSVFFEMASCEVNLFPLSLL